MVLHRKILRTKANMFEALSPLLQRAYPAQRILFRRRFERRHAEEGRIPGHGVW